MKMNKTNNRVLAAAGIRCIAGTLLIEKVRIPARLLTWALLLLSSLCWPILAKGATLTPSDNTEVPFMGLYTGSPIGAPVHSGGGIDHGAFTAKYLYRSNLWLEEFEPFASWANVEGTNGAVAYGAKWKKANPTGTFVLTVPMLIGSGSTPASGVTYTKAVAGDYDSHFVALANNLINNGLGDCIIRLGHEFNGGFYPWHVVHSNSQTGFDDNPANYAAYWRRIVTAMRFLPDGVTPRPGANFKYCWNGALLFTNYPISQAFPGVQYVDYVGIDFYDSSYASTAPKPTYPYTTSTFPYGSDAATRQKNAFEINRDNTNYGFNAWKAVAVANGLPMAIPEWGVMRRNDGHGGLDDPDFIKRMYDLIHDSNNLVAWHVYFDYQNDIPSKLGRYPTTTGLEGTEFPRAAARFQELFGLNPVPLSTDIGTVGIAGSGTPVAVTGAGSGYLTGTSDHFHFSARTADASDEFMVQITGKSVATTSQSGIMLRDGNTSANAAYAALFISNGQCIFQTRSSSGTAALQRSVSSSPALPVWLRLLKRGDSITAYKSSDGLNWSYAGGQSISLSNPHFGVAVSSGDTTSTNKTDIANVDAYDLLTANTASIANAVFRDDGDSTGVVVTGASTQSVRSASGFMGSGYRDFGPIPSSVTLSPTLPTAGFYSVYARWPQGADLADNAPLSVTSEDPVAVMTANQTTGRYQWAYAGTYNFAQGSTGNVTISRPSAAVGVAVADAVMFVPLPAPTLPDPKVDNDIGAPSVAGSASFSGGVYNIQGAGSGFNTTTDQFNFVNQDLTGNQTMIARVTGLSNTDANATAGVQFRGGLAANSAFIMILTKPNGKVELRYRTADGLSANFASGSILGAPSASVPIWLKLVKNNSSYFGYYAQSVAFPTTWSSLGPVSMTLPTTYKAGLAVTSRVPATLATGTFDNVSP